MPHRRGPRALSVRVSSGRTHTSTLSSSPSLALARPATTPPTGPQPLLDSVLWRHGQREGGGGRGGVHRAPGNSSPSSRPRPLPALGSATQQQLKTNSCYGPATDRTSTDAAPRPPQLLAPIFPLTQNTTCLRRRRHTSALTRPSLAPHSLAIRISISAISARLRGQHTQAQRRPATPRGLTSHLNLVAAPHQAPLCVAGWLRCGTARWCTSWAGSCERRLFTPPAVNRRGGVRVPRQRHLRRLRL